MGIAFRRGFNIQGYNVKIRTLSEELTSKSFSIPINKGESIETISNSRIITNLITMGIFENHKNSLKEKKMVSGLSNFLRWVLMNVRIWKFLKSYTCDLKIWEEPRYSQG